MARSDQDPPELETRLLALERRVAELEDERELRDLLALYSFGADVHRDQTWVDLFTPDGTYDLGTQNVEGAYNGHFEGPDDLLGLITGPGMPARDHSQHHHGPIIYRFDAANPDEAWAESYSVTFLDTDEGTGIFCAGFNRWRFRRVDGHWRIAERHRREIGTGTQAEVIGAVIDPASR
jgi:hypothetical protein